MLMGLKRSLWNELGARMVARCVQKGGPRLGYEMEAFAIYDVMMYVKPPIRTLCVGTAFGEAAMLMASGTPGMRGALPSSTIMLRQPIQRFEQMQASDIDIYRNELRYSSLLVGHSVNVLGGCVASRSWKLNGLVSVGLQRVLLFGRGLSLCALFPNGVWILVSSRYCSMLSVFCI